MMSFHMVAFVWSPSKSEDSEHLDSVLALVLLGSVI